MGFHPDLTGRQNVYHSAGLMGFTILQIDAMINELESFAEIGEYFDQPVRTYSSGMQARVSFAVATAVRPDILIVDEALSVGDAYFQAKCYERIALFKSLGTTLLLVTHSMSDIVKHCDRAVLIKNGILAMDSSPKDISNLYFDELFGKGNKKIVEKNTKNIDFLLKERKNVEDVFNTHPGYRKEEYRWGNGGAKIIDYTIISNSIEYPSQIESTAETDFLIKVHFEKSYTDITIGFLIKTHDGLFLYGTNSFLSLGGKEIISVNEDDVKVFKFSLPMTLNSGHYLISFGVSSGAQENLEPLDRRYDAILLNIERPMAFWGMVDLEAKFEMENINE
jgi:lipopolysaccharide transport system ATP-binding protein